MVGEDIHGIIDDFCIIDKAKWLGEFEPPSGYISENVDSMYIASTAGGGCIQ